MTSESTSVNENEIDNHVDDEIATYLNLDSPKSFFLFAGAGSGKTRSLIKALKGLLSKYEMRLRLQGRSIGVITYTNAACDEIKRRLEFHPLVAVSTIHSFVWSLISGFDDDIKFWLEDNLNKEISDLEEKEANGRSGTKASLDRIKSMESKRKRIGRLAEITKFNYNPNGDNREHDSLNYSEVLKIGSNFLLEQELMQKILVNKYPILLIDESQDTNKLLIDALFSIQAKYKATFCLGLIGDTMQRIYSEGKEKLGENLAKDWETPIKKMNHRSPKRIIKLINKIRSQVDTQQQTPRSDSDEGTVRLFIFPNGSVDKAKIESSVMNDMATITGDPLWSGNSALVKVLTLEHHMAASRMGFLEMFEPLYKVDDFKTGLLDGKLPMLGFFTQLILPIVKASEIGDDFAIADIVQKHSPLLEKATLREAGQDQLQNVEKADNAVKQLIKLWDGQNNPSDMDVLNSIKKTGLFRIPEIFEPILLRTKEEIKTAKVLDEELKGLTEKQATTIDALDQFLKTSFSQISQYEDYVNDNADFDTHQGIKGLEFKRVMVIMDDSEARGFMFSYEKLFGVKEKTKKDIENEGQGKDTGIDRTRRLFYVTCSRAEASLALVAYTSNPQVLKDSVVEAKWFEENEVVVS